MGDRVRHEQHQYIATNAESKIEERKVPKEVKVRRSKKRLGEQSSLA